MGTMRYRTTTDGRRRTACGRQPWSFVLRLSSASSAFTLAEVLVALAIVAIALVALLRLHVISIVMSGRADRLTQATLLANAKMAETLAAGYPEEGIRSGMAAESNSDMAFHWQVIVADARPEEVENVGITGIRGVRVQVTWKDGQREESVQTATYVVDKR